MQEKTLPKPKIRTSNIHSMDFGSVSYDIFGSPYQKTGSFLATDSLDFGYLGKPYNADTELYDYGFRDYSPETARFTSVDPIRDGRNWFSYVVNDPVNYVDLWGLQCQSESDGEMKTSEKGVEFIKKYEKFVSEPYKATENGNLTIGYGHEIKEGESFVSITEKEATELLKKDLEWIEEGINKNYEGSNPLTQQQFDALVSLGINAGRSGLVRSEIFKYAEQGVVDEAKILEAFRQKNTSQGVYLKGLDYRRYDEAEMYLYGDYERNNDLSLDKNNEAVK